jgi:hypothetical protein
MRSSVTSAGAFQPLLSRLDSGEWVRPVLGPGWPGIPPGDASSVVSVNPNDVDGLPANPLISVCVPMYNNRATIARCLRSVLDQDGVEFEIVVVDDDSSDDSAAVAATMLRGGAD